jgi:predicted NBD/HSP70 family sugar kinase
MLRRHPHRSRTEIARQTGLTRGAVSRITAELLEEGLVVEEGSRRSTGGRPQTRLRLNNAAMFAVGADVNMWETRFALADLGGKILQEHTVPTPSNPQDTLDLIATHANELLRGRNRESIEGIGVSAPGVVNRRSGEVDLGFTPDWNHWRVSAELERRLKLRVCVENSTRSASLAEYYYGSPEIRGSQCLLYVRVDEGIGVGILLNGTLYYGPQMAAGEFGQMIVSDKPGLTEHFIPGCLEQLAANPETCARYRQRRGETALKGLASFRESAAQVRAICCAANRGDSTAVGVIRETAEALGRGIHNLVWIFNPDTVVVNGAIVDSWPLLRETILKAFPRGEEFFNFRKLNFRPSSLGEHAALMGSVALPFHSLFLTGRRAAADSAKTGVRARTDTDLPLWPQVLGAEPIEPHSESGLL